MMRRISDMAAMTEDWLEPARPVDAPVALLLSEASDLWEIRGKSQNAVRPGSEETNLFQEERKAVYYALRHAGYRVDLITEADVREGWLERYRALYVIGENMERATVQPIAEWVKKGGLLYLSAGAARKNEYDEPFDGLNAVLGRGPVQEWRRYRGALRAKLELPFLEPLAHVQPADGERDAYPALAVLERFAVGTQAVVLARFDDGTPAAIRTRYGQGAAYTLGVLPGLAWLHKALPRMPCGKGGPETTADGRPRYPSFEPVDFDEAAGQAILRPLIEHGVPPDLRTQPRGIVANRLVGPKGTVLTVVHLAMQQRGAAEPAVLEVAGVERVGRVWSYEFPTGLPFETREGRLRITVPRLEWADLIVIEK